MRKSEPKSEDCIVFLFEAVDPSPPPSGLKFSSLLKLIYKENRSSSVQCMQNTNIMGGRLIQKKML